MNKAFYPNALKSSDIDNLEGWKLKVATLHFGKGRGDCVTLNYGYTYRKEKRTDHLPDGITHDDPQIIITNMRGCEIHPISLRGEIEWDSPNAPIKETGRTWEDIVKNYLIEQIR